MKLRLQTDKFWVDAFAARPVQIRKDEFNDSDSADNLFGIYAGTDILGAQKSRHAGDTGAFFADTIAHARRPRRHHPRRGFFDPLRRAAK